ncbi:hypothetical protein FAES_0613 [Fibrella aestuarina BUZ 2]|uniref:DUF4394 domain-containing protein n=1 Tax=Fibrella aestuarina BUZ 2 TaxID=1166018 RepID=I0K3C1_9BACT|nr:DUF4394 domain-containing protein [Fibrella aestuarina]CCG98624.1 hypothetical protein FAES_0613 [Fibrella aestuarina BUZ 2]
MLNYLSTRKAIGFVALGALLTLGACDHRTPPDPSILPDVTIYALNDANQLIQTNVRNPNAPTATVGLTGLQQGEQLVGIDFRPATGQLYGISNQSRLYIINQMTGVARAIGNTLSPTLTGTPVGFDFNPTVDRIRVTTAQGQNLRLNPETGAVQATDGSINGVPNATITAVAYTNNRSGVTTTTLYDIDPVTDQLYIQNPPNDGRLVPVGPLGLDVTAVGGFDIAPDGRALAATVFNGQSELSQVDLSTGKLQKLGNLPGNIIGLAIPAEAVAYAVDGNNNLHIFNPLAPSPIIKPLTGLQSGESIYGIDFRPVNGQLYALGSTSRLYTINVSSGAATAVATLSTPLTGTTFGFDFNPTVDRIRIVSSTGQNLRVNPADGVAVVDGAINGASTNISASAYTNNFAGAGSTTLYSLDNATGNLYTQAPPNNGTQVMVGSLGLGTFEAANGFDIGGMSGMAYALLRVNNAVSVYRINLTNGTATLVTALPSSPEIRGMAVGLGF